LRFPHTHILEALINLRPFDFQKFINSRGSYSSWTIGDIEEVNLHLKTIKKGRNNLAHKTSEANPLNLRYCVEVINSVLCVLQKLGSAFTEDQLAVFLELQNQANVVSAMSLTEIPLEVFGINRNFERVSIKSFFS